MSFIRALVGYAVLAILVLLGFKVLGIAIGLVGSILWLAFLGFLCYLVIRLFSPKTADRIKDTIKGDRPL